MPRARKSDKFFIYAPKKHGRQKGQRLLGVNGTGECTAQDLLDFLKEKRIDPRRVPLPRSFVVYAKPEDKYPPISPGTSVRTTQENSAVSDWSDEAKASRQWGVRGETMTHHDSHGLSYEVRHPDGSIGHYDPSELKVL